MAKRGCGPRGVAKVVIIPKNINLEIKIFFRKGGVAWGRGCGKGVQKGHFLPQKGVARGG